MENFKQIIGFEGLYEISDHGTVVSFQYNKTGKVRKSFPAGKGYPMVSLRKDNRSHSHYIHRLVAVHFLPNPLGKKEVNHIDANPANFHVSNLEWVTPSENKQHAIRLGRWPTGMKNGSNTCRGYRNDIGFDLERVVNYYEDDRSIGWISKKLNITRARVTIQLLNHYRLIANPNAKFSERR